MTAPNLFVLGAPKCATTSLYDWLGGHPQVWCPAVKEPGWFTREEVRPDIRAVTPHHQTLEAYLALFTPQTPSQKVFVDGSTSYLRSTDAMREIATTYGDAQAIAVVRDPVDLVSSYFSFLRYRGWEDQTTLADAWRLQDERRAGRSIPAGARRPSSVVYADVARLGEQVRDARSLFGDRLVVLALSDLQEGLPEVSRTLQERLGLDHADLGPLPRENSARTSRRPWLDRLVQSPPKPLAIVRDQLKRSRGRQSFGVKRLLDSVNSKPVARVVDDGLRDELRDYFAADVAVLSSELDRDFRQEWGWE